MKQIIITEAFLDAVLNTQSILVFENTAVRIEVKPRMEVTFIEFKVHVYRLFWLKVGGVNSCIFRGGIHICCLTYCAG